MKLIALLCCAAALAACATPGADDVTNNEHGIIVTARNVATQEAAHRRALRDCSAWGRHPTLISWNQETHTGVYRCE